MTVWFKQGVQGDLNNKAQKALGKVAKVYRKHKEDLFVTSIREGNHGKGSLHYIGDAFDIRKPKKVWIINEIALIKEALGVHFDVVEEATHIHIEYDPK